MEKYLNTDAKTLEELLAACTDFKERRNIREALRELKGLKLDGDKIVTYSFGADTLKRLTSLKTARDHKFGKTAPAPTSKTSDGNEVDDSGKVIINKNGYVSSPVEEDNNYSNYLYVGSIGKSHNNTKPDPQSNVLENGHCVCEDASNVTDTRSKNNSDVQDRSENHNTYSDNLNIKNQEDATSRQKRSHSSPLSRPGLLSSVSKTVLRLKNRKQASLKESVEEVPNDIKANCDKVKKFNDIKLKAESDKTMKTQDTRRNFSESSVPSTRNELSWADEIKKERSKSCNTENDYDIDGVKIRKKPNLSRKNRVESEWNMSPRLSSKFRKKIGSSTDSISNITSLGSSTDSVVNAVNTSEINVSINADETGKEGSNLSRSDSAKKPPVRRKLPDIPVKVENEHEDSDENVHERTLRLLQERRQKRRDKMKKGSDTEAKMVTTSSNNETVENRPKSKKKEIRLRRELQLLNRASESIISKSESQLRKSDNAESEGEVKPKSSHPVRRSKSDMVRSKPPITPESAARKVEETKTEVVVAVDLESFDAMPTENKIDLIGNLMQEEAKLQETLRRTTSFSERRKIRSEVRQLREKRTALEGSPEAQPVSILQRSVSLSSGELTPGAKVKGSLSPLPDKKSSIDELRKQLSETSDYDEKRKIRLALRQLRQQSRESDDGKQATRIHRSQSCVETKSPRNSKINKTEKDVVKTVSAVNESSSASESKTSTSDKVVEKQAVPKTVVRSQSAIELKPNLVVNKRELSNAVISTSKGISVTKPKSKESSTGKVPTRKEVSIHTTSTTNRQGVGELHAHHTKSKESSNSHSKLNGHNSQSQINAKINGSNNQEILTNGPVVVDEKCNVQQHSALSKESKNLADSKHSSHHLHSKTSQSISKHSTEQSKSSLSSKQISQENSELDFVSYKAKSSNTPEPNSASQRKGFSVGEYKQPEKFYVKQRKHSLESLADSYRLRDQEDKNKRQVNSEVLKNVIGKLEDKISKSLENKISKPSSKILISRAKSESSLIKRLKDSDIKSKDTGIKHLTHSKELLQKENEFVKSDEKPKNEIIKTSVKRLENSNAAKDSNLDAIVKVNNTDRLSPNIPWLEEKKKSSPTPNDLDKLMSTMDIEDAFSQILDAVEHFPGGAEMSEPPTPDAPIVPIVEEEQSCESSASGLESASEEVDENKNICEKESRSNRENRNHEKDDTEKEKKKLNAVSDEITKDKKDSEQTDSDKDSTEPHSAINSNSGIMKKSEAQIQLKSSLSLDLSPVQHGNTAASVLHSDDGTVTVQEVNRVQEGDTTITKWKKVRRTKSRTEERETDTIKERMVTSPGGTSSVYEKDVSKTKRKLTSRGSDYFTRNNYNLRRLKDFEGTEIVEHELTSECENLSVTKNESWGSKSEAKVVLNKDENGEPNLKAITAEVVPRKDGDVSLTSGPSSSKSLAPQVQVTLSKTSSGYGSVSGSEEEEREDVIETPLGRPSGCPVITNNMKEVTASEGSLVVLECSVTSSPLPTITWYKGDDPLQETELVTLHFGGVSGKALLKITEVTPKDIGDYRCVFTNPLGTAETKAKLNVKERALDAPSFVTDLADVKVSEGCSIVLECEVTGVESVSWYKDGIIQRNSSDFRQTFNGVKAKLEIGEVFLDDDGTYTCAIKNNHGESRCSCKVTVTESESEHIVAPAFLKKLESQIVDEQDMVIMECDIIGSPQPIITWYCDRKALLDGDKFSTSYDGRVARLIMKSTTKGDNGRYECTAESSAGRISCDCLLVVKDVKKPPLVAIPLSDHTVDDGNAAILECCIMGNPVPQIVWRKNGLIIGQMFDFKQTFMDNLARLEISKVCVQDSGCYECVATSDLGETSTSCNLTVQEKPVPKPTNKPVPQSTSNTQNEAIPLKEDKANTPSGKTKSKGMKDFPSGFTAISDQNQVKAAKSQASKIMLVRQSSLKSVDRNKTTTSVPVKRSESFQMVRPSKKEDPVLQIKKEDIDTKDGAKDSVHNDEKVDASQQKLEMKGGKESEANSEIKSETLIPSKTELTIQLQRDLKDENRTAIELAVPNASSFDTRDDSEPDIDKDSERNLDVKSDDCVNKTNKTVEICNSVPKSTDEMGTKTSVSSINLSNISQKSETGSVDSDKENELKISVQIGKAESSSAVSDNSDKVMNALELDHNENIKVDQKSMSLPHMQVEQVSDKAREKTETENDGKASPKLVIAMSTKDPEKSSISALKTAKDSAISKFERLCSEAEETQAKPRFKVSSDIRRTQSVRTAGNEKPEWLQMKLKRVGEPKSPATERRVIAPVEKDTTPKSHVEKPTSVPKDIKLTRSNSARIVDRKVTPPLTDSTNTHVPDRNNEKLKISSVSERAKMFQTNQESSPVLEKKNPSAIIAKAINLSRAESMRAPVGHRSINVHNVQRSHSFKTSEQPASEKGVTLDLTPPKSEGKESSGESGVAKKPIKYWDPTAAPASNMDYNSINDEEQLQRMLTSSDNFEERKKLRARIKEVRDLRNKKWEEDRKAREAGQEDLLLKRQREADLEKQRKLEAFKVQAAQPHEQKHLEVREQRLKEKMREADEQKQKALETFDRLARHEDLTAKSTVHTESKDGKTVTVRKVETVSKTAGVGGMSYGKPAEEETETLVTKLINASSPHVSGSLNVKTESWSSKDGITHKSEKTESWGAKKQGAMNAFKQMDAKNNPQTNPLIAYTFAKKAAQTMVRNAVTIKQDVLNFCKANTEEYKETEQQRLEEASSVDGVSALANFLGPPKGLTRSPSAIKTMLLEWTKAMTREYTDKIQIENFSTSWNDGIAFCALIHHFYPQAFDFYSLDAKNRRSNFELAFDTAEKYADIAPLLDVEDMVKMKKPDWKCVFTYVQSFYRKLKDHDMNKVKGD